MGASLSNFFIMFSYELPAAQMAPPKAKRSKSKKDFQNKPYQYNSKNMRKKHNIKQPGLDVQRRKQ